MQDQGALQVVSLSVDADDPLALARFWAAALRWDVDATPDGIALVPTDGTRFGIQFRPVPGAKAGPHRLHLDLTTSSVEDQEQTVAGLLGLGARHLDVGQGPQERHVVLADPEGNEFCLLRTRLNPL